jgi:hypothetical protein
MRRRTNCRFFAPTDTACFVRLVYADWQAHNRLLGQLSVMASIGSSGLLLNCSPAYISCRALPLGRITRYPLK